MELHEFATRLLFSDSLTDKLSAPMMFTDDRRSAPLLGKVTPGRSPEISITSSKAAPKSPTPRSILDINTRGAALYTFAHHELQAIELMALALLRFPEAPKGFRLGLANIIKEEQLHFSLYQRAAEKTGVSMRDIGGGDFFWKSVENLSTPADFLAALSLTFEQANLDFSLYWKRAFEEIEEFEIARILQKVYNDEVKHVAHGMRWFNEFTSNGGFEAFKLSLKFPLSVGRAKGPIFDRLGRQRAGLSDDFIDEMEISNSSRGRPPRIFTFDPFIEEQVAKREVPSKMGFIKRDLASIMWPAALKDDIIIANRPTTTTLLRLSRAGFKIPEFVSSEDELSDRPIGRIVPWGVNQLNNLSQGLRWSTDIQRLFDKRFAFEERIRFMSSNKATLLGESKGQICETVEQVKALIQQGGEWIAKKPFSTSGQHRRRLSGPLSTSEITWLTKATSKSSILVEPWYMRLSDISVQLQIGDSSIKSIGVTRFWTGSNGSYKGSIIGGWGIGMRPDVLRSLNEPDRQSRGINLIKSAAQQVGEVAQRAGFRGALGVDSMIVTQNGLVRVVPILEINPRFTMGRLALELTSRCAGVGGWFFISKNEILKAGYSNLNTLIQRIEGSNITVTEDGKSLESGTLFTTEPRYAERIFTVLCIDKSLGAAQKRWEGLGFNWPTP